MKKSLLMIAAMMMCCIQSVLAATVTVTMNSTAKVMTLVEKGSQAPVDVGTPAGYIYTFDAAPGTYVLTGWDTNSHTKDYGTIELEVTDEPQQEFKVFVVTATCQNYYADTKTGWAYGTDFTITDLRCNTREGKLVPITLSDYTLVATSGNKNQSKYLLTLNGNSYNFRMVPSDAHKAEGYMDAFGSGTMTANATCQVTIPTGLNFTVTYPSDANMEIYQKPGGTNGSGSIHYVSFMNIAPASEVSNGGTTTKTYTLADGTTYNYRLWKDGKRTKAGLFVPYKPFSLDESKKWDGDYDGFTSLTFTNADLDVDAKWMNHDVLANNKANVANILLTVNERGYLAMKTGESKQLGAQRDWQLTNNSTGNYFIEPQYHYTVLNLDGTTGNDVVTIEKAADNFTPWANLKANKPGSAIVLVSYDAMKLTQFARSGSGTEKSPFKITESDYLYGSEWSALWPENTGVFVVTVDGTNSAAEPNMLINEKYNTGALKNAGKYVDAEHDVFYYLENEPGFTYTFTPSGVASVEIAYPTIGETTASYNGFSTTGVTKNEDGSYSLLLKNGRQIVKLTDASGNSVYQVLTAKPCTQTVTNKTRNDGTFLPGDDIEIQFAGLYHPANKMAGIYNMSAYVTYKGVPNGTELILGANQYQFAGTPSAQLVKARIPANWNPEDHFVMDDAVLQVSGFGDPIGNHRYIDPIAGRSPNFTAIAHQTYFGALPNIEIAVETPDYIKAGFDITPIDKEDSNITLVNAKGDEFEMKSDNRFWLIPDTYTYTIVTDGYKYVTGNFKITGEETADVIIPVTLEAIPANGWDGLTIKEPAKVTAEEAATDEFAGMENYYKITNGFELAWMAKNVNDNLVTKTNAVLCNDITLSDMPFTTIGSTAATPFKGVFEGNGHTISGINLTGTKIYTNNIFGYCDNITVRNFTAEGKITTTALYASIIGRVQNGGTITDITSNLDITSTGTGSAYASGIVSWLVGANGVKYNVERCQFNGSITANGRNYAAGIVGYNTGNYDNITIKDCSVAGSIKAGNYVAGIIPVFGGVNSAKAVIENCLVISDMTATSASVGAIWAGSTAATGVANCYTDKEQKLTTDQGELVTEEQLASGEVAYRLGEAWGQEIGVDAVPVLGGMKVFMEGDKYVNEKSPEPADDYTLAILTFEDKDYKAGENYVGTKDWSTLIDDPQYGGPLLYGDGMGVNDIDDAYRWSDDNNTWLSNIISEGYGSWAYWSGGHAISNYGSGDVETYGDYLSQLTVFKKGETDLVREGAGHNGSNNFAVHYGYSDNSGYGLGEEALPRLKFSDGNARVIDHMYINNTCYAINCYVNGNDLTASIGDNDWVKIVATGYNEDVKGKTAEFYLVNGPKNIVMDWTKWDLSSLGKVTEVTFNITGSSDNGYGFSQPAYFAYDDVAVRIEKTLNVATLENEDLDYLKLEPDSHMPMVTEDFDEEVGYQSGDFWFEMFTMSDYGTWWGYGVANHTATCFKSLDDQYNCIVGKGVDGSDNYGIAYIADFMGPVYVSLTTDDMAVVPGVYVTNAAYAFESMLYGDAYAKQFGQGDWFKLTATGYDEDGEETKTKDFYLADFRSEDKADWYIINDWRYMDLSTLGKVRQIQFTLSSTDNGSWGMNTPSYFCFDNFGAKGTETTIPGNYNEKLLPTGISNVNAAESNIQRFDILGRRANNIKGIQIIRNANGTVRKVVMK